MKKIVYLIAILFSHEISYSQDTTNNFLPAVKISDITGQGGIYFQGYDWTFPGFKALAPGSALLQNDLSGYYEQSELVYNFNEYGFIPDGGGMLSVKLGLNFLNKKKQQYSNATVRTGLSYFSNCYYSSELYKAETNTYDSFYTDTTFIYLDSVSTNIFSFRHEWKQLNVDVSLMYTLRQKRNLSFGVGIGFAAGLIFNSHTTIGYQHYTDTVFVKHHMPGNLIYHDGNAQIKEEHANKDGLSCSVYVPLEMNINLHSRNHPFWKKIHFTFGVQPGINYLSFPGLHTMRGVAVPVTAGLRFSL